MTEILRKFGKFSTFRYIVDKILGYIKSIYQIFGKVLWYLRHNLLIGFNIISQRYHIWDNPKRVYIICFWICHHFTLTSHSNSYGGKFHKFNFHTNLHHSWLSICFQNMLLTCLLVFLHWLFDFYWITRN